jgi:hypothetical protein
VILPSLSLHFSSSLSSSLPLPPFPSLPSQDPEQPKIDRAKRAAAAREAEAATALAVPIVVKEPATDDKHKDIVFDGGFFAVKSPVRSPASPRRYHVHKSD